VGEVVGTEDDVRGVWVARLALGAVGAGPRPGLWTGLLERAIAERCAALAWLRSGSVIRESAPAALAADWRRYALAAIEDSVERAMELTHLVDVLTAAGASPIALKGLPLSVRLYGEAWARPTTDVDLFVPLINRRAAHRALIASGYRHLEGLPPAESTYERVVRGAPSHVELHSSLFDENLLAHVAAPAPESAPVDVNGTAVLAQVGVLEPVFLAAHLAKHARVALLWWIDFATLWTSMPEADQAEARVLAERLGLDRYLAWAEQGVGLLNVMRVGGNEEAVAALVALRAMHRSHNARRVIALAAHLSDKARVFAAWIWPRNMRRRPAAFLGHAVRRVVERIVRRRGSARPAGDASVAAGGPQRRILPVEGPEFLDLIRSVIAGGGSVWVRIHGTSMLPAIPRGSAVLLAPLPPDGAARGQIVFAQLPEGPGVLHRVVSSGNGTVVLKGDNLPANDAPLPVGRVIAVARAVEHDGATTRIGNRPPISLRAAISRFRRRLQHA
jgi:hypothetical protein